MEFLSITTQMGPDLNLQPKVQWPHRGSLSPGGAKGWTVGAKNGEHKGARRCNASECKTPQAQSLHDAISARIWKVPNAGRTLAHFE